MTSTNRAPLTFTLSVYRGPFMGATGEFRRVECQNITMIRNPAGRIEVYYLIDGLETFRGYSEEVSIRPGASSLCLDAGVPGREPRRPDPRGRGGAVIGPVVHGFGVRDSRGREIGCAIRIAGPEDGDRFYGTAETPYVFLPHATRNGASFGAVPVRARRKFGTLAEA